jgi:hypothetical protein
MTKSSKSPKKSRVAVKMVAAVFSVTVRKLGSTREKIQFGIVETPLPFYLVAENEVVR